jgi:hypothetical protein
LKASASAATKTGSCVSTLLNVSATVRLVLKVIGPELETAQQF